MTRLAQGLFAVLVLATFSAFFVAQRLKSSPPKVEIRGVDPVLSPNRDGRKDRGRISFVLQRSDRVDVAIIDGDGDFVRELIPGREVAPGRLVRAVWNGREDDGRRAPDGEYRARINLRRQGQTLIVPRTIVLDTTPPKPRVLSIGPDSGKRPTPELLPRADGKPAEIRFFAPGTRPSVEIWRTDRPRPRLVTGLQIETELSNDQLPNGVGRTTWDGTRDGGRRVSPGTYVAVVRSRDAAGNIGRSVPERTLLGRHKRGQNLQGRGGITIRYLAAQPPMLPTTAGGEYEVAVDARGQTYNWTLRKVGDADIRQRSRRGSGGPLIRRAPRGESGLYLFEARTATRRTTVPVPVDDRKNNRVLVVLPTTTWQGRNLLDDDGDGLPNTLELGMPVRLNRVFARGLPEGITENEGPLLARLHRAGLSFDLTTDTALAVGGGPRVSGHRGVLLAGDTRWLTEDVRRQLRAFVAGGGVLASFGTQSLRSEVRQTPRRVVDPTPLARQDLFGARLDPIRRKTIDLQILEDDPSVQLFAGEEGLFPAVEAWEATRSPGSEARRVSSAVTPDGQEVIVAARFGRGLVIRTGIPGLATRLGSDPASAELFGRIWTLLRTG